MSKHFYIIPMIPIIQGRPRVISRGGKTWAYDPNKKERQAFGMALLNAREQAKNKILEGSLHIYVAFYGCGNRCDLDNLLKSLDSANGILWKDDRQILQIHASMVRIDQVPRTELELIEV